MVKFSCLVLNSDFFDFQPQLSKYFLKLSKMSMHSLSILFSKLPFVLLVQVLKVRSDLL